MDFLALMDKANRNKDKAKKKIEALPTPKPAAPPKPSRPVKKEEKKFQILSKSSSSKSTSSSTAGPSSDPNLTSAIQQFKAKQEKQRIEDEKRKLIEKKELIKKRVALHEGKHTAYMAKACGLKSVDDLRNKVYTAKVTGETEKYKEPSVKPSVPAKPVSKSASSNFLASIVRQQNQALGKPDVTPSSNSNSYAGSVRDKPSSSGSSSKHHHSSSSKHRDKDRDRHKSTSNGSRDSPKPEKEKKPRSNKPPSAPPPKFTDLMKMASNPDELKKFQIDQMRKKVLEQRERQTATGAPVINRFTGKPVTQASSSKPSSSRDLSAEPSTSSSRHSSSHSNHNINKHDSNNRNNNNNHKRPHSSSHQSSSSSLSSKHRDDRKDRDRDSSRDSKKPRRSEPERRPEPPAGKFDLRDQMKNLSAGDRKTFLQELARDMSKTELAAMLGLGGGGGGRGSASAPSRSGGSMNSRAHLPPAYRNGMGRDREDLQRAKQQLYGSRYDEDDDDDEEDEYDSEMDDFIDDTEDDGFGGGGGEYDDELRNTLQSVFKYDKDKFRNEKRYDDRRMEVKSWRDIEKEEKRSSRLALLEDAREMARGAADLTGNH